MEWFRKSTKWRLPKEFRCKILEPIIISVQGSDKKKTWEKQ